jgi:hypothetical protein
MARMERPRLDSPAEDLSIPDEITASYRSTIMWLFMLFAASLVSSPSCTLTSAQTVGDKVETISKVSQELIVLYDEYSAYLASGKAGVFRPSDPQLRIIDNRVVVDAVASGDVEVLKSDLISLGMQRAVAFGRTVSGELPIPAIRAMAALPSLNFARAVYVSTQRSQEPLSPGIPNR